MLKHPLPDTAFSPTAEPHVDLCPVAEPLWQVAPRHPGTITIQRRLYVNSASISFTRQVRRTGIEEHRSRIALDADPGIPKRGQQPRLVEPQIADQ